MKLIKWIICKILSICYPNNEPAYLSDSYKMKPDETKRWMENTVRRDNHDG